MIQDKYLYLIFGLFVGYVMGATSLIMLIVLSGLIGLGLWKREPGLTSLLSKIKFISNLNIHKSESDKVKINAMVDSKILFEIAEYCRWKGESTAVFIENASLMVFAKDKDWKSYQRISGRDVTKSKKYIQKTSES